MQRRHGVARRGQDGHHRRLHLLHSGRSGWIACNRHPGPRSRQPQITQGCNHIGHKQGAPNVQAARLVLTHEKRQQRKKQKTQNVVHPVGELAQQVRLIRPNQTCQGAGGLTKSGVNSVEMKIKSQRQQHAVELQQG